MGKGKYSAGDIFTLFFLAVVAIALAYCIYMLIWGQEIANQHNCEEAALLIGLPTKYERHICFVEIADGVWVREYEIKYNLQLVDVEKVRKEPY